MKPTRPAKFPAELIAKAWELGLVRGVFPEAYGGYGDARSAVTGAIVAEELASGDLAIALHMLAPRLMAYPVLEMGRRISGRLSSRVSAQTTSSPGASALIEPRFDFDPAALATTARREGSDYKIEGAKCFVPLATRADAILVYAALESGAGFDGVGAFVVPRNVPGLGISEREKNMGLKGLETHELTLDCRIAASARLGGEKGINFTRLLSESRVAMAAMAAGVARAAYEYARAYAKERKAFGVPIATKQAMAFMLAEMATEIDATRLLVWEAAALSRPR